LVERAMASSDTPRCMRMRRRFGPNDSRELMAQRWGKIPTAAKPSVLQGFPLVPVANRGEFCNRITVLSGGLSRTHASPASAPRRRVR
jgi:hypothetical protein